MNYKTKGRVRPLADSELIEVCGGNYNRGATGGPNVWKQPGYKAPTVLLDDGINIQTTDPSTTNVGYDSPFTPIPA